MEKITLEMGQDRREYIGKCHYLAKAQLRVLLSYVVSRGKLHDLRLFC